MRQYDYLLTNEQTEVFEITENDKFITVYNNSNFRILIYSGRSTNSSNLKFTVPIYTALTFPITKLYNITFRIVDGTEGQLKVILSEFNLNVNVILNSPQGYSTVSLINALPAGNNNIGNVDVLTLPSIPAGDNNIGNVDIASALPAGTNNIGKVDINSIPAIKPAKITLTAGTDYTVKSTAGKIYRINSELTDLLIKDNTEEIWKGPGDYSGCPIKCNTNIKLNSVTGGIIYIQFE